MSPIVENRYRKNFYRCASPLSVSDNSFKRDNIPGSFIHALNTAARAVGMTEVAKKAGVSRASLYKSLAENSNPMFSTISKVTKALGCRLSVG